MIQQDHQHISVICSNSDDVVGVEDVNMLHMLHHQLQCGNSLEAYTLSLSCVHPQQNTGITFHQ